MQGIHSLGLFALACILYFWNGGELAKAVGTIKEHEEGEIFSTSNYNLTFPQPQQRMNESQWCPKAQCRQQRLCQTCSRRFLIVFAQGRSASTTLIEMLDLLPNVRMGGENERIVTRFHEVREILEQSSYGREQPDSAWKHNPVEPEDWVCAGQNLIETIYPPKQGDADEDTILGFKTIRFGFYGNKDFNSTKLVEVYKAMFPCARFLINIRSDTDALLSSRKNAFSSTGERQKVTQETAMLREVAEMFGEQAMLVDSTHWTKTVSILNEAISWLGFHETCHFKELLEFNTAASYRATKSHLDGRDPRCHYVG